MFLFNHNCDYCINTNVMQEPCLITSVNTIAERLKQTREDLKLSQDQLAKQAGVSQGTIGNIESGTRKNPRELLAIARALGVTPEWLKSGKGIRTIPSFHKSTPEEFEQADAALNYEKNNVLSTVVALSKSIAQIHPSGRQGLIPLLNALVIGPDSRETVTAIATYIVNAPEKSKHELPGKASMAA